MYFYSEETHIGDSEYNLMQHMKYGHYPPAQRRFPACLKQGISGAKGATIDSFRDTFYRAMYRLLLAGAVLSRAYLDPLFRAREEGGKEGFFVRTGLRQHPQKIWATIDLSGVHGPLTETDIAYIRQSPVYNYDVTDWSEIGQWRNREYENIFGPFASWIVEDGRGRQQNMPIPDQTNPEWADTKEDVGAVRELMLLLVAYDVSISKFANFERHGRDHPSYLKEGIRTVSIVRFGVFHVEEIIMPVAVENLKRGHIVANYHSALVGTEGENIPYQFDVWRVVGELDEVLRTEIVDERENPGPPPLLELWHFVLRQYLNLGFRAATYWMPRWPLFLKSIWWKEVGRGEIFISPNWAVVQKYKPGVIS